MEEIKDLPRIFSAGSGIVMCVCFQRIRLKVLPTPRHGRGGDHMTSSLALFVYLIFMMAIFVVAAYFTKNKLHRADDSEEEAASETPFVETTETVEFSESSTVEDGPVHLLLPNGHEHKLHLCRIGVTAPPGVEVYVAEGITLMAEPMQMIQEPPRTMEYDCEARLQFPDGQVQHVTRCYGGSSDEIGIEIYAGAGITLIVKIWKLVNY